MIASPNSQVGGSALDNPPPQPAMKTAPRGLIEQQMSGGALGEASASPQAAMLQGLQEAESGLQKIAQVLPQVAPQFADFIMQLRQIVPQAAAAMSQQQGPAPPPMAGPPQMAA